MLFAFCFFAFLLFCFFAFLLFAAGWLVGVKVGVGVGVTTSHWWLSDNKNDP